ncbi:MAG: hypothetical protein HYZ51_04530 [Candidatus Doudnabacteria bacterium]|nr:hypothetical protein [Candidatus Doudnabacteria bacterium]
MPALMDDNKTEGLLNTILALKDLKEAKAFFRDLLTPAELNEFGNRWLAARMLNSKVSYNQIQRTTGLSTTTIARISKWLKRGRGGYKLMLKRSGAHHNPFPVGKGLG